GVEDRVVVAAAEFERDLAGDGLGDPALRGFAEHDGLRIEPAALVEQAAELAAVLAVLLDGVLVVDAGYEALVSREEQRKAWGFIDAAGLGFDDAVLDLIAHAEAVAAADVVGFEHQLDGVFQLFAVQCNWPALFEADADLFGFDGNVVTPEGDAHDGLDNLHRSRKMFQVFRFVCGSEDVGVGGVGLLGGHFVAEAGLLHEGGHLGAAAQLVDEGGVEPGLVDFERGVDEQAVAVEALDVVALEGRAVAPDVDVVLLHGGDEHGAGDGAADGRGVEVGDTRSRDVEGAGLQRGDAFSD